MKRYGAKGPVVSKRGPTYGLLLGLLSLVLLLVDVRPAEAQLVQIEYPADQSISYRDKIAVIARGRPGTPMTLTINGEIVQVLTVRDDQKADFLNVTAQPGPNLIMVTQEVGRRRRRRVYADSVSIHVVGPVAKVELMVDPMTLPADSSSRAWATVRVLDEWGMPLQDGQMVTLEMENGRILAEDMYPEQPGLQVQIRGGVAEVELVSGSMLGVGRLQARASTSSAEVEIGYTQPHESWRLTGMAIGQVGWRADRKPGPGVTADIDGGAYSEGKVALFGRGSIARGLLLTASYDSDRRFDHRVFRFLTPERFFPIHGDASSIFYEAPSTSRLFVRVSHEQSYLQYGDFATRVARAGTELLAYNRSFTGASSVWNKAKTTVKLFGASTDQAIQVDEAQGEGISGPYYLSAARLGVPIVEGSERVVLQTRDRLHPELVVQEDVQYRFTDYEINYDEGSLLFKRPVLSRTPQENPIIIVVTYETARALTKHVVGGGRVGYQPHDQVDVGGTVIGEERTGRNFWLTGMDAEWRPTDRLSLTTEVARTSAELLSRNGQDGWAWKLGARGQVRRAVGYELYYRDADLQYNNPSSPTARPGVRKIRGRLSWSPLSGLALQTEAFHTDDAVNAEKRMSAIVGLTGQYKTFRQYLTMETTNVERATGSDTRSTILSAGAAWTATPWMEFGAKRDQAFGSEELNYRPTLNRLTTKMRMTNRLDLVGEHAFRDGSLIDSSFTSVGIQSRVAGDLVAYANYELDGGINGYRNQAVVGLRHQYRPHPDVTLNGGVERVSTMRGNSQGDFTALSVAGEYLPPQAVKASWRYERRDGQQQDKVVASEAADVTLWRGLSFLIKHTYLDEQRLSSSGNTKQARHHLLSGLAYRSLRNDYLNVLGKYEYKYEDSSLLNPAVTRSTHIGSLETIIEPKSQIEWFVRYGFKVAYLNSEGIATTSLTDLWMTNMRYEWRRQFDVLGEYRILWQHTANDLRHGVSLELGIIPQQSMRLALGYNFTGFEDRDFAGNNYWAHGPFLKMQVKFTESTVGGWLHGLQAFMR